MTASYEYAVQAKQNGRWGLVGTVPCAPDDVPDTLYGWSNYETRVVRRVSAEWEPLPTDCGHNYNDPTNPCPTCANDPSSQVPVVAASYPDRLKLPKAHKAASDRSVRPATGGSGVASPSPVSGSTPSPTSEETKK